MPRCFYLLVSVAVVAVELQPNQIAEPKCGCDPSDAGFCDADDKHLTYRCDKSAASKTCASKILAAVLNETTPDCSCLIETKCIIQPQAAKVKTCPTQCYDNCWGSNSTGCPDDDDNNDYCVYFCAEYCTNHFCQPTVPRIYSACETDCGKQFMDQPHRDQDSAAYADCMYNC
jgi:hypothetical protein